MNMDLNITCDNADIVPCYDGKVGLILYGINENEIFEEIKKEISIEDLLSETSEKELKKYCEDNFDWFVGEDE
jgi:hypothetical protein